jgi:hypothetical protein
VNNSKQYTVDFIGPRQPYVRRQLKPVKPARKAKRIAAHVSKDGSRTREAKRLQRLLFKEFDRIIKEKPPAPMTFAQFEEAFIERCAFIHMSHEEGKRWLRVALDRMDKAKLPFIAELQ